MRFHLLTNVKIDRTDPRDPDKVITEWFSPERAEAAIALLQDAGFEVDFWQQPERHAREGRGKSVRA